CSLVVANDSGPMHLAAAVGRPVVSIFGPTDPVEKHPLTKGSFYFWKGQGLDCSPCYSHGAFPDCKTLECMRSVAVEEVFDKVRELAGVTHGGL
ncbi:MAG: glycosyltransferase family 9 protein, partial [Deltaproteobacteria bacterium]|nr:glycosyltransferase family 9 protein [Deltaproteobacteria bacterium]